jgi:cobalt-precorrin 5A hydrolase
MVNEVLIITHTEKGTRLGEDLSKRVKIRLRAPRRFLSSPDEQRGFTQPLSHEIRERFLHEKVLILIMELETAVRTIAPFLNSRKSDPAVLLLDEAGDFVIPLCLGLGCKTELHHLVKTLAELLGARPIITWGTERKNIPTIEDLAEKYHWKIENRELIPRFGEALSNGEPLVVWDPLRSSLQWPEDVRVETGENVLFQDDDRFLLILGYQNPPMMTPIKVQTMALRPSCFTVGIVCSGAVPALKVVGAIRRYFRELDWSVQCIKQIVAIDSPLCGKAIRETVRDLGTAAAIYSAAELQKRDGFAELISSDSENRLEQLAENLALLGCEQGGRLIGIRSQIGQVSLAVAFNPDNETVRYRHKAEG